MCGSTGSGQIVQTGWNPDGTPKTQYMASTTATVANPWGGAYRVLAANAQPAFGAFNAAPAAAAAQSALPPPARLADTGVVGAPDQTSRGFIGSGSRQTLNIPLNPQPGIQAAVGGGNAGLNIPS